MMPLRERTAWISLLSISAVYGLYVWSLAPTGLAGLGFRIDLLDAIIALVVVQSALTLFVLLANRREPRLPRDEREQLIDMRATRVAYAALATSIAFVCFFSAFDRPLTFDKNALLFILVAAEVIRSLVQIIQFRRSE